MPESPSCHPCCRDWIDVGSLRLESSQVAHRGQPQQLVSRQPTLLEAFVTDLASLVTLRIRSRKRSGRSCRPPCSTDEKKEEGREHPSHLVGLGPAELPRRRAPAFFGTRTTSFLLLADRHPFVHKHCPHRPLSCLHKRRAPFRPLSTRLPRFPPLAASLRGVTAVWD